MRCVNVIFLDNSRDVTPVTMSCVVVKRKSTRVGG